MNDSSVVDETAFPDNFRLLDGRSRLADRVRRLESIEVVSAEFLTSLWLLLGRSRLVDRLCFSGSFGSCRRVSPALRLNDRALIAVLLTAVLDDETCSLPVNVVESLRSLLLDMSGFSVILLVRRRPSRLLALWSLSPPLVLLDRVFVALLGVFWEDLPSELRPLRTSLLDERVRSLLLERAAGRSVVFDVLSVDLFVCFCW